MGWRLRIQWREASAGRNIWSFASRVFGFLAGRNIWSFASRVFGFLARDAEGFFETFDRQVSTDF